jgi:channel protein, hemolysin III family
MARTKLKDRLLPNYTRGEEIFNMVSHIVGGAVGIAALVLCVVKSALKGDVPSVLSSIVYGCSMIFLYTMSSVYHGLKPPMAKKVFQVIDHCTIYFLIAGTYTPYTVITLQKTSPLAGWIIFGFVWGLTALAVTLTAIDLKMYRYFSFTCYILMGWCIVVAIKPLYEALGTAGTVLLFAGGILYTLGSIFYVIGKKRRYNHSVFHLFVLLGSIAHLLSILLYVI